MSINSIRPATPLYKAQAEQAIALEKQTGEKQYKNVEELRAALSEKYNYFNSRTNMSGVPTTVTVDEGFLRECVDDPEKLAFLEENLAAIPRCASMTASWTRTLPGSPEKTHSSVIFNRDGSITSISGCSNDPKVIARKNNELKRLPKARTLAETMAEKRAEKREKEKKIEPDYESELQESLADRVRTFMYTGRDVESLTQKLLSGLSEGFSLDLEA